MTDTTPWLTVREASEYVKKSELTVRNALMDGALVGFQNGPRGRWRVKASALDAWIRGEVTSPQPVVSVTRKRSAS